MNVPRLTDHEARVAAAGMYLAGRENRVTDAIRAAAADAAPVLLYLLSEAEARAERAGGGERPRIVCLCGSTQFTREMLIKQWNLTKKGMVVLSWCALPDDYLLKGEDKAHIGDLEGVKEIVDEVHLRKIDLADEIFVLNVDGYIGKSTARELAYARAHGKIVKFLEPESVPPTAGKEEERKGDPQ